MVFVVDREVSLGDEFLVKGMKVLPCEEEVLVEGMEVSADEEKFLVEVM